MAPDEEISSFISSSFPSIWSLELLLHLKGRSGPHSRDEIINQLRASELVVGQALDALVAGGLAITDENGMAAYQPATPDLEALVERAESLYRRRPNTVRRWIIHASGSGLSAFADAFRVRKD